MTPTWLACNYLIEAEELLAEGAVHFDYFKFPSLALETGAEGLARFYELLDRACKKKPVLYHGIYPISIKLCEPDFTRRFDLGVFKQVCELTGTPGFSIHLDGARMGMSREAVVRSAVDGLIFLKENFPDMSFISLENTEHSPNQVVYDPEVISEIVRQAGVGFLLDISHANWAAGVRGETLESFISRLPMERLVEIHLNGWINFQGEQIAHLKIQDELYPLIKDLIACSPAQIITLEYGRSLAVEGADILQADYHQSNPRVKAELREQLLKLAEMI